MMDFLRLIFVSVLVTAAWGDLDDKVCIPVDYSCGPPLPPLPINFETKGGHVDHYAKAMGYQEIYFDFDHLRAKHVILAEAIERHLIFDYNVSQVIEYYILHPGSSVKEDTLSFGCSAGDIRNSPYKNIFGYRFSPNGMTNTPMYDAAHVLRIGGPYQFAFNGKSGDTDEDDNRGLNWNAFNGCVYEDEGEITARVRYKFSGNDVLTSGGSMRTDVDGSGLLDFLPVPLSVDYTGTQFIRNSQGKRMKTAFNISESFSWFKANPVFDNKNLQIPPWMHCDGFKGWKKMPDFPMAFSVNVETSLYTQNTLGEKETGELLFVDQLYYYNDKGLARRDFTPHPERDSDILAKFEDGSPVKQIFDYSSLQLYTINKATGRCYSQILDQHGFFSVPDVVFTEMANPKQLFLMDVEVMEYKGQYFTRDIECDVWNGKQRDNNLNLTLVKETYFTTNGWHSEVDEKILYSVPIKHTVIANRVTDELRRTVSETNFFKFKPYPPVLIAFDISECVETTEHSYYSIRLSVPEGDPQTTLQTYRFIFLEAAQYYLATVSELGSPLRIQKINLSVSKSGVFLTFAMLEKPTLINGVINTGKGSALEDAVKNLRKVVDGGNFEINFVHPLTQEQVIVIAEPGDLYEWFPAGKITDSKETEKSLYAENQPNEPQIIFEVLGGDGELIQYDDPAKEDKKEDPGMSGGALAGLGIGMLIVGLVIGIGVMYLYIRRYDTEGPSNDYVMHQSSSS